MEFDKLQPLNSTQITSKRYNNSNKMAFLYNRNNSSSSLNSTQNTSHNSINTQPSLDSQETKTSQFQSLFNQTLSNERAGLSSKLKTIQQLYQTQIEELQKKVSYQQNIIESLKNKELECIVKLEQIRQNYQEKEKIFEKLIEKMVIKCVEEKIQNQVNFNQKIQELKLYFAQQICNYIDSRVDRDNNQDKIDQFMQTINNNLNSQIQNFNERLNKCENETIQFENFKEEKVLKIMNTITQKIEAKSQDLSDQHKQIIKRIDSKVNTNQINDIFINQLNEISTHLNQEISSTQILFDQLNQKNKNQQQLNYDNLESIEKTFRIQIQQIQNNQENDEKLQIQIEQFQNHQVQVTNIFNLLPKINDKLLILWEDSSNIKNTFQKMHEYITQFNQVIQSKNNKENIQIYSNLDKKQNNSFTPKKLTERQYSPEFLNNCGGLLSTQPISQLGNGFSSTQPNPTIDDFGSKLENKNFFYQQICENEFSCLDQLARQRNIESEIKQTPRLDNLITPRVLLKKDTEEIAKKSSIMFNDFEDFVDDCDKSNNSQDEDQLFYPTSNDQKHQLKSPLSKRTNNLVNSDFDQLIDVCESRSLYSASMMRGDVKSPPDLEQTNQQQLHQIKRRILFNNAMSSDQKGLVQNDFLACQWDKMGRIIDQYGKFLYDDEGQPAIFSGNDITKLQQLKLIKLN